MRRPLPVEAQPIETRPYRTSDAEELRLVNNRSFAHHRSQGDQSPHEWAQTVEAGWFRPEGTRILEGEDGRIVGFVITKIHPDQALGEIYVIGLDPSVHGRGLGGPLTAAGLAWHVAQIHPQVLPSDPQGPGWLALRGLSGWLANLVLSSNLRLLPHELAGPLVVLALLGLLAGGLLVISKPYIRDRLTTFMNPSADSQGSSYQVQQSLIAVGSGHIVGRGFGQSVQKFSYLPEPIGDSIFAVAAEEWGFVGSTLIVFLYLVFLLRALWLARRAPDMFGRLLIVGLATVVTVQSFVNIASMLALFPLSGMPLIFVSKGGTAMLVTLASIGIILNVSKYRKKI